jgi:hypothetical protein
VRQTVVDRWIYRAGLACCPPAFRREYASEMLRDFDAGRNEAAAATKPRELWFWRLAVLVDLARTMITQWGRSGLPVIALVSASLPLLLAGAMANLFSNTRFTLPTDTPDAESIGLVLLASVVVVVIATAILFTTWATHATRRRSRPGCSKRAV